MDMNDRAFAFAFDLDQRGHLKWWAVVDGEYTDVLYRMLSPGREQDEPDEPEGDAWDFAPRCGEPRLSVTDQALDRLVDDVIGGSNDAAD